MDEAAPSIICQVAAANGCSSLRYHWTVTMVPRQHRCPQSNMSWDVLERRQGPKVASKKPSRTRMAKTGGVDRENARPIHS